MKPLEGKSGRGALELWGGVECTVARIGDLYRDQVAETGHRARIDDLDRIAALGIATLRYPVLWETVSPNAPDVADFSWHDERMRRMQALRIEPIAGLCHHGSGPRYTDLLDPAWPDLLARHAARVARRFPQIGAYTPVNEPVTTARFAGLYGHWHPHGTGYGTFLRSLVTMCKATVLAMRAIREVRSDAQLVQTDDLGRTFSTRALAHQAEHENERRWLSFDLLCGRVDRTHPWWPMLLEAGVAEADLHLLLEADAAPDVIGINHYLTSERFLDERSCRYPNHHLGGNGRDVYVDVEAVRIGLPDEDLGPAARLREAWQRYGRPVAITEAHHGCTRDEQLRWLSEVWRAAETVRGGGAEIRAVTIWALFGTVDWNSLLTRRLAAYEPGPYDVRGPAPRRTALADAAEALARGDGYDHPVLDRPGWWKREGRFYPPIVPRRSRTSAGRSARRLLIVGATGPLGAALTRICHARGLHHVASTGDDPKGMFDAVRPWAVIDTGTGRSGTLGLASVSAAAAIPLLVFSSDRVFDGTAGRPYLESDPVAPSDVVGRTIALRESAVMAAHSGALVVRAGPVFCASEHDGLLCRMLTTLARGDILTPGADVVSPTYAPDLVHEALNLLIDGASGLWHLANTGALSWAQVARQTASLAGYEEELVQESDGVQARSNFALASERGALLPPIESALERYIADRQLHVPRPGSRLAAE